MKLVPILFSVHFMISGCQNTGAKSTVKDATNPSRSTEVSGSDYSFLDNKELSSIEEDRNFSLKKIREVKQVSKIPEQFGGRTVRLAVSELKHIPSGIVTIVFLTFNDEDDGGNVGGWIEDKSGRVIREIHDGGISEVRRPTGGRQPDYSFFQGKELAFITDDGTFKLVKMREHKRVSKIPGQFSGRATRFMMSSLTHIPSDNWVIVMVSFNDEDDGGATAGWIQDGDGKVVGIVEDGTIKLK